MLFAPVFHRTAFVPSRRSFDRLIDAALREPVANARQEKVAQDDKAYTLSFDVPGIAKDQLSIGIEGNVVRLETLAGAARQYKAAYELPVDIEISASEAKLENGVLTLKLAKKVPVSKVTQLAIN
jgi:HSP20 family molecular chaperone IbpA